MIYIDKKALPGLVLAIIGTVLLTVFTAHWSYPVIFFGGSFVGSIRFA